MLHLAPTEAENTKRTRNYTIPLSTYYAKLIFKTQILLLFWTPYLKLENQVLSGIVLFPVFEK